MEFIHFLAPGFFPFFHFKKSHLMQLVKENVISDITIYDNDIKYFLLRPNWKRYLSGFI